jgi:hypothetical protein
MADIDPAFGMDPTEFQTIDCADGAPAHDTVFEISAPALPTRRCVSSQDLPRFSRTSLQ